MARPLDRRPSRVCQPGCTRLPGAPPPHPRRRRPPGRSPGRPRTPARPNPGRARPPARTSPQPRRRSAAISSSPSPARAICLQRQQLGDFVHRIGVVLDAQVDASAPRLALGRDDEEGGGLPAAHVAAGALGALERGDEPAPGEVARRRGERGRHRRRPPPSATVGLTRPSARRRRVRPGDAVGLSGCATTLAAPTMPTWRIAVSSSPASTAARAPSASAPAAISLEGAGSESWSAIDCVATAPTPAASTGTSIPPRTSATARRRRARQTSG